MSLRHFHRCERRLDPSAACSCPPGWPNSEPDPYEAGGHGMSDEQQAPQLVALHTRIWQLEDAVAWALGTNGDFGERPKGKGQFWWREELQQRAGMLYRSQHPNAARPSHASLDLPALARYDLITNYRAGSSIEEMERSDDGDWVRYEDVVAALQRVRGHQ